MPPQFRKRALYLLLAAVAFLTVGTGRLASQVPQSSVISAGAAVRRLNLKAVWVTADLHHLLDGGLERECIEIITERLRRIGISVVPRDDPRAQARIFFDADYNVDQEWDGHPYFHSMDLTVTVYAPLPESPNQYVGQTVWTYGNFAISGAFQIGSTVREVAGKAVDALVSDLRGSGAPALVGTSTAAASLSPSKVPPTALSQAQTLPSAASPKNATASSAATAHGTGARSSADVVSVVRAAVTDWLTLTLPAASSRFVGVRGAETSRSDRANTVWEIRGGPASARCQVVQQPDEVLCVWTEAASRPLVDAFLASAATAVSGALPGASRASDVDDQGFPSMTWTRPADGTEVTLWIAHDGNVSTQFRLYFSMTLKDKSHYRQ